MPNDQDWGWDVFVPVAVDALTTVLGSPVSGISQGDHLLDDVGLDSFGLLLFVTDLEERFRIELPASDDEPTAGNLFRLVTQARAGSSAGSLNGAEVVL